MHCKFCFQWLFYVKLQVDYNTLQRTNSKAKYDLGLKKRFSNKNGPILLTQNWQNLEKQPVCVILDILLIADSLVPVGSFSHFLQSKPLVWFRFPNFTAFLWNLFGFLSFLLDWNVQVNYTTFYLLLIQIILLSLEIQQQHSYSVYFRSITLFQVQFDLLIGSYFKQHINIFKLPVFLFDATPQIRIFKEAES